MAERKVKERKLTWVVVEPPMKISGENLSNASIISAFHHEVKQLLTY
jgi:hypothetical protein